MHRARGQYCCILDFLGKDDVLVVTRLDRLARSVQDGLKIIGILAEKSAHLKVLQQPIDTTTPEGRLFFTMTAGFSEFELGIRKARQAEGIALAKRRGVYKGRKPTVPRDRVLELRAQGMGPAAIARTLKVSESSVFRILGERNARLPDGDARNG
jgi:DNA invertase Pin-like site-specific DNA recombinase